jgi:homoserine O-acetyltransferase
MRSYLGDVVLREGDPLQEAQLAYKTIGTLNHNKSTALVYPTWFSGSWVIDPDGVQRLSFLVYS